MTALQGQVAIITGASRGIGPAIAEAFAGAGAAVVLAARNAEELGQVAGRINSQGGTALAIPTDVSSEEQVRQMIQTAVERFGKLDILVNNAGVGLFNRLVDSTTEQWDWVMEITLKGAYLCAREALKVMVPQRSGLIINIGSDLSYRTSAECGIYGTAKYGVAALTQVINQEHRLDNIRCTGIYPGMIDTYFAGSEMGDPRKKDWLKASDLANACLYVASQPPYVRIDEIRMHPMIQDQF